MASGPDSEIKIKFTTEHDGKGADAANRDIDQTKKKTGQASGEFGKMGEAAKSAARTMQRAMAGLGFVAIIAKITDVIKKIQELKIAREDVLSSIAADNSAARIETIARSYDQLAQSIESSRKEQENLRGSTDELLAAERRLEDARLARREEEDVAAISQADPHRADREREVRARYAGIRAGLSGSRERQDLQTRRERISEDIAGRRRDIGDREESIRELREAALDAQERAGRASAASVAARNRRNWLGMRGRNWYGAQHEDIERYAGYAGAHTENSGRAHDQVMTLTRQIQAEQSAIRQLEAQLPILAKQAAVSAVTEATATAGSRREVSGARQSIANADAVSQEEWRLREADRAAELAQRRLDAHDKSRPARGSDARWRSGRDALQEEADRAEAGANASRRRVDIQRGYASGEFIDAGVAEAARGIGETSVKGMREIADALRGSDRKIAADAKRIASDIFGDREAAW